MTAAIMIQLITGAIGSVGFGILFHIKKKYLPLAAVGGFLSWLVFLLGKEFWGNVFLPTLMAGFVTDVYAEILARICKETSTSFFVTSVIPLIPGSTLYYCMNIAGCTRRRSRDRQHTGPSGTPRRYPGFP